MINNSTEMEPLILISTTDAAQEKIKQSGPIDINIGFNEVPAITLQAGFHYQPTFHTISAPQALKEIRAWIDSPDNKPTIRYTHSTNSLKLKLDYKKQKWKLQSKLYLPLDLSQENLKFRDVDSTIEWIKKIKERVSKEIKKIEVKVTISDCKVALLLPFRENTFTDLEKMFGLTKVYTAKTACLTNSEKARDVAYNLNRKICGVFSGSCLDASRVKTKEMFCFIYNGAHVGTGFDFSENFLDDRTQLHRIS